MNQRSSQSGGALLEATLLLPVLALVVFGLMQMLNISQTYLSLNMIAREAILPASTTTNASQGEQINLSPSAADIESCLQAATPAGSCAHLIAHWRIRKLLESNRLNEADFDFLSRLNADGVTIQIKTNSNLKVKPLGSLIKVSAHADYLATE